ncbi:MAG: methylated-DNA--[protein]-cysteine S-methyltransferase [Deltaproteobacteria bacterium]|nr:methylated-DNA--[protein]-cysteine S-methyltransferase [Deltaproteobacteria bacterium]
MNFKEKVIKIVKAIPKGKVLSYGQVASLAGFPRGARHVGGVLMTESEKFKLPWHRVINAQGGLSTYRLGFASLQKRKLQKEGLKFNQKEKIKLKEYTWEPSASFLTKIGFSDEEALKELERQNT